MKNKPLVSVLTLSYNNARYTVESLNSVKSQTYDNIQHIIIDDCSTDNSVELIEQWITDNNHSCTFIKNQKNIGICKSLNKFLSKAEGKYISLISSDDNWLPQKLEKQTEYLESLPEDIGVVYSDTYIINSDSIRSADTGMQSRALVEPLEPRDIFKDLLLKNTIPANSTVMRKKCFDVVGFYDESIFFEDWDMNLRIAKHFKFVFLPGLFTEYRVHANSIQRNNIDRMVNASLSIINKYKGINTEYNKIIQKSTALIYSRYFFDSDSKKRIDGLKNALKYSRNGLIMTMYVMAELRIPPTVYNRCIAIAKKGLALIRK